MEERKTEDLVRYLVGALVDNPDDVVIERRDDAGRITFEVSVHEDDVGKVIGRQGRIVKAIRSLARAAGLLEGEQVYVDVLG